MRLQLTVIHSQDSSKEIVLIGGNNRFDECDKLIPTYLRCLYTLALIKVFGNVSGDIIIFLVGFLVSSYYTNKQDNGRLSTYLFWYMVGMSCRCLLSQKLSF